MSQRTRIVLIAPEWSTATLRLATKLLLADEDERGDEPFVLYHRTTSFGFFVLNEFAVDRGL